MAGSERTGSSNRNGQPPVLKVTQVRSTIGCKRNQRETMRSLGLRRIRQSVVRADSPQLRGMIAIVRHLVAVEEVNGR